MKIPTKQYLENTLSEDSETQKIFKTSIIKARKRIKIFQLALYISLCTISGILLFLSGVSILSISGMLIHTGLCILALYVSDRIGDRMFNKACLKHTSYHLRVLCRKQFMNKNNQIRESKK